MRGIMLLQIALGAVLALGTIVAGSLSLYALEGVLQRAHRWLILEPHWPKMFLMVVSASVWALAMLGVGVGLWAAAFMALSVFDSWELSVYFALECFTTLGFGDVLMPPDWRILGGMAAANGLLNFGLMTAVLMEGVRDLRLRQSRHLGHRRGD